jgi:hypothetical protein
MWSHAACIGVFLTLLLRNSITDEVRELEAHAKGEDVEAAALSLGRLAGLCRWIRAGAAANGASNRMQ